MLEVGEEPARPAKRAEVIDFAVRPRHVVVVGEDVPEAVAHEVQHLTLRVHRLLVLALLKILPARRLAFLFVFAPKGRRSPVPIQRLPVAAERAHLYCFQEFASLLLLFQQKRTKTCLTKVTVCGERFRNAAISHEDERYAISEPPFLIWALPKKSPCPPVQGLVKRYDLHPDVAF